MRKRCGATRTRPAALFEACVNGVGPYALDATRRTAADLFNTVLDVVARKTTAGPFQRLTERARNGSKSH